MFPVASVGQRLCLSGCVCFFLCVCVCVCVCVCFKPLHIFYTYTYLHYLHLQWERLFLLTVLLPYSLLERLACNVNIQHHLHIDVSNIYQ